MSKADSDAIASDTNAGSEPLEIKDLSLELLVHILSFVPVRSLPDVYLTCQLWRRAVDADWKARFLTVRPCSNVLLLSKLIKEIPAKAEPKPWSCPACTLINEPNAAQCEVCEGSKPDEIDEPQVDNSAAGDQELVTPEEESRLQQRWKEMYKERMPEDGRLSTLDQAFTYYIRQEGKQTLFKVHISDKSSILRLNYRIMDQTGIPPAFQQLTYQGRNSRNATELQTWTSMKGGRYVDGQFVQQLRRISPSIERYAIRNREILDLSIAPSCRMKWKAVEGLYTASPHEFSMEDREKDVAMEQEREDKAPLQYRERVNKYRGGTLGIYVKTLTGKTMRLPIGADCMVCDVMWELQDREGIPPDQQRIVWAGMEISKCPYETLGYFGVEIGDLEKGFPTPSVVHLVLRLRGD